MASFACVLQTSCQFIVFVLLFEYIYLEKKSFVCCDISSLSEPWYHSYFCGGAVICTFPVLFFVVCSFFLFLLLLLLLKSELGSCVKVEVAVLGSLMMMMMMMS